MIASSRLHSRNSNFVIWCQRRVAVQPVFHPGVCKYFSHKVCIEISQLCIMQPIFHPRCAKCANVHPPDSTAKPSHCCFNTHAPRAFEEEMWGIWRSHGCCLQGLGYQAKGGFGTETWRLIGGRRELWGVILPLDVNHQEEKKRVIWKREGKSGGGELGGVIVPPGCTFRPPAWQATTCAATESSLILLLLMLLILLLILLPPAWQATTCASTESSRSLLLCTTTTTTTTTPTTTSDTITTTSDTTCLTAYKYASTEIPRSQNCTSFIF